jgi:predicted dithiol-disulfide oxidoreductase (DUF899 family)
VKQTRLDEPAGYAKRRWKLGDAAVERMRQREKVAALRRQLPRGAAVEDDAFLEGVSSALSSGTQTLRWYAGLDY